MGNNEFSSLSVEEEDRLIRFLHKVIRLGVKVLALIMTLVILLGIGDVLWVLYQRLTQPPRSLFSKSMTFWLHSARFLPF